MAKKAVIAGVSAILLVTAVIGVIAITNRLRNSNSHSNSGQLTASSKSITALCAPAVYKDICERTLRSGSINETSTAGDIIRAAVHVIAAEVQSANQQAHDLHSQAKTSIDNDGFEFCKQLLGDAGDQLSAVIAEADNVHRLDDFQAWLSMVISYRTNCLASIEAQDLNEQMTAALRNTTELTDNAIAIVSAVGELAQQLNLTINGTSGVTVSGRRLLSNDRYPSWMAAGDRKILSSRVIRPRLRPNVVVAKDGSGQFKSINAALNAMPKTYRGRYVIYVKAGIYVEKVTVEKNKPNLLIYGDGPRKTIVTGRLNYAEGVGTFKTATFSVQAPGFIARSMGFTNTAGPKGHQAVALRLNADAAVIYNCRIDGFQDSFYSQSGRHFVRNSVISGTIDFIFGDSQVVIQNCLIILRHPMDYQKNTVTAHGKDTQHERTGIVIQNCRIVPDLRLYPDRFKISSYLGRPWKQFSTTVVMESTIGDLIRPEGWLEWNGNFALDTLYYAEYNNRGPGSPTYRRVRWRGYHVINRREAFRWTASVLLAGRTWIPYSGVPNALSLMR
ncbi:pectinesterase-like [Dendrobium catenatum]|uniref:Pectinesterase n=1 Tax=Dendrobium catenatum TaxID=906689 RepID=A0A2I0W487_9ASPA|nr:pectinesterase-like [Dendrobium catenatum]PKU70479.1 putative pectinesterase/pectinesterase inhibitor 58 [Dendrobium catenatum]